MMNGNYCDDCATKLGRGGAVALCKPCVIEMHLSKDCGGGNDNWHSSEDCERAVKELKDEMAAQKTA